MYSFYVFKMIFFYRVGATIIYLNWKFDSYIEFWGLSPFKNAVKTIILNLSL